MMMEANSIMDHHDDPAVGREPVLVRPMTRADLEAVAALSEQLGYPIAGDALAHHFELLRGAPENALFVAEHMDDEQVVGWAHVAGRVSLETGPFAQISRIVVEERRRGHGIGRALMAAAEAWEAERGYDVTRLWSNVVRERAHHFYADLGYEHIKTSKVFRKILES
jgi:GNAT superfamily N-acetyltransferase